jgi:hypothetical protein
MPVRFSFAKCDTGDYCVTKLATNELEALYKRMGYFEQLTWLNVKQMPHEKGISIDKSDQSLLSILSARHPGATYGHFRVNGTNANTRVFIARDRDLARVLLIDREGSLQH